MGHPRADTYRRPMPRYPAVIEALVTTPSINEAGKVLGYVYSSSIKGRMAALGLTIKRTPDFIRITRRLA